MVDSILKSCGIRSCLMGTVTYRGADVAEKAVRTTPESPDLQKFLRKMRNKKVTHAVLEASSHALYLKRLDDVHFDAAVFTNLTDEHLDFHGTRKNYLAAKSLLFSRLLAGSAKQKKYAVLNIDDPFSKDIERSVDSSSEIIWFGIENGDVRVKNRNISYRGINAELKVFGDDIDIDTKLVGDHNLSNILASVAVSYALGADTASIKKGMSSLEKVPGRMEKVPNRRGLNIYVDYAHTEDALRRSILAVNRIKRGRLITLFGCGGDRDRAKRPGMGKTAAADSDMAIVTSDNPRSEDPSKIIEEITAGIDQKKTPRSDLKGLKTGISGKGFAVVENRKEAIAAALDIASEGDSILIAGKGHEDYQETASGKAFFSDVETVIELLGEKKR
jgi:UDP-N-acetylmuramoyl-L-alanyl-D-glutamate--2,6-diaminopimelate ligase